MKKVREIVMVLLSLLILGIILIGCDNGTSSNSNGEEIPNNDPKIIKLSFVGNGSLVVGGKTYSLLVGNIEEDDWVTIASAESPFETGFSQNIFTFELFEVDTTTPWTGNGLYYLQIRIEDEANGWFYTAGRNIPPETNITTYKINQAVSTISIDQFKQM